MLFILIVFTKPTLNQRKQTKTTCNVGILVALANIGYLALTAAVRVLCVRLFAFF